jgi:hypothetical protein
MHLKFPGHRDILVSLIILLVLALPFLPLPGDYMTQMEVRLHTHGDEHAFNMHTLYNVCAVMETTLAFEDPGTGEYTRIRCDN